jgi:hypothetical protein
MDYMDERRKWKNVNNEEEVQRLKNELKTAADNAKKEYLESTCDEIIGFKEQEV